MVIYSAMMVLLGTLSLAVLFCLADCLWLGFTVATMQLLGILFWVGKLLLSAHERLDVYFSVPIAYSVLSCLVLFGHLAHAMVWSGHTGEEGEENLSRRTEKTVGVKTKTKEKGKGKRKGEDKRKLKAAKKKQR